MNTFKFLLSCIILLTTFAVAGKDYKASLFGVKSDGVTLNTRSIQKAIDFISENGGGRLVFYVGRYLTGSIHLKTDVTVQLEEGAVLAGVPTIYDYSGFDGTKAMIIADSVKNTGITGKGVIEGQGLALSDHIRQQIEKGYLKETVEQAAPALVYMQNCSGITIDQINLRDACGNVLSFTNCRDMTINGTTLRSIQVAESKGILLNECDSIIMTGIYFETSGKELNLKENSKNIFTKDCINKNGKQVRMNP